MKRPGAPLRNGRLRVRNDSFARSPRALPRTGAPTLLLITNYFPFGYSQEFLDWELPALARAFAAVRVAPLAPLPVPPWPVPDNVSVDLSLARSITPHRNRLSDPAARMVRRSAVLASPAGWPGMLRGLRRAPHSRAWLSRAAIAEADRRTVSMWARDTDRPSLAYTYWMGSATVALREAWPGVPLATRVHRGDLYSEVSGFDRLPLQGRAVAAADLIAAISRQGRDYLLQKYPRSRDRVELHYLGTADPGGFAPRSTDDVARVWSVSTLVPVKRVETIAAAVVELARTRRVHWTHVGDGPRLGAVLDALAERPPTLTVDITGMLPHDEVLRRLRDGPADVFVNASDSEGLPVSLMEAAALGIPIVAADVGGTSEVAPEPLNVLLRPRSTPLELAAAAAAALQLPAAAAGERRQLWRSRFDGVANAERFADRLLRLATADTGWK